MQIKIYINGRFLCQSITGVQRYAIEIVKKIDEFMLLDDNDSMFDFIMLSPKKTKYDIKLKKIKYIKRGKMNGHLWEQIELPVFSKDGFLINFCNTAPIVNKKQIVTIHDASIYVHPKGFSKIFRIWYKFVYYIIGKRLKNIFTVSEFSSGELQKYCKIPSSKIKVNYLGIDHILRIEEDKKVLEKYELKDKNFVLAVGSLNYNKNFQAIIKTAKIKQEVIFVIVGGFNNKIFSKFNLDFPPNVKYIGYVTDEELVGLYKEAECFLYPSLYEGFGLPPLEAMACGCPVIISNCASLPEICNDNALYCDPNDEKDIARKIDMFLMNFEFKEKYKIKGQRVIKKYKWDITVENLFVFLRCDLGIMRLVKEFKK